MLTQESSEQAGLSQIKTEVRASPDLFQSVRWQMPIEWSQAKNDNLQYLSDAEASALFQMFIVY